MLDAKLDGAVCTAFEVWAELVDGRHPREAELFDALVDMHLALIDMNFVLDPYNDAAEHEAIANPLEMLQCAVNAAWDAYAGSFDEYAYYRFTQAIEDAELACELACADEFTDFLVARMHDDLGVVNDALGLGFDFDADDLDAIALAVAEDDERDVARVYAQFVGEIDDKYARVFGVIEDVQLDYVSIDRDGIGIGGRVLSVRFG